MLGNHFANEFVLSKTEHYVKYLVYQYVLKYSLCISTSVSSMISLNLKLPYSCINIFLECFVAFQWFLDTVQKRSLPLYQVFVK